MSIDNFIKKREKEYKKAFKESTLNEVSRFLFEPRYEVNNLKFKKV